MGVKTYKIILVIFVMLILKPVCCYAGTADDLYEVYDIPYVQQYPDNTSEVMFNYNNSHRFFTMYHSVVNVDYDTSLTAAKVKDIEQKLNNLREQLNNGFYLSTSDIYELESEYMYYEKQLNNLNKAMEFYEVEINKDYTSVPTKEEYEDALAVKNKIDAESELGDIYIKYPVKSPVLADTVKPTSMLLAVKNNAEVTAMYNGTVMEIGDTFIAINHNNDIYSYYGNISNTNLSVGDKVKQGDVIAYSTDRLLLKLKLGNKLVDISKVLEEDD